MSSSTVMDSFDAPMLDYSGDMDVHMQTTVSSPKPWIQPETIMEEDVHTIHLPNPFPSHLPQQDVEIDMDDYYNENVEYEMADGEITVVDTELVDIDVYDATREEAASASASISHPTGHTDQDVSKEPTAAQYLPSESEGVATTDHILPISDLEPALHQSAEPELLTPTPLQATVGQDHDTNPSDPSDAAIALQESALPLAADTKDPHSNGEASTALERHTGSPTVTTADADVDNVTVLPLDDSEQKRELESSPTEHESSTSVPQNVTPDAVVEGSHQAEIQDSESHGGVRIPDESYEGGIPEAALDSAEAGEPERPAVESHETEEDDTDPHEISEGVYIEPPPPVLIELPLTSNQPVCSLFNLPPADTGVTIPNAEASYTVLLQNRPTLYYETLNDFFDALREEEPILSITEFADGEMVIDAYDLQLVVSEDNVHAREISLHDLNVLHHGLDLIGPLRLRLRTVLPRFINRYRGLQSQVTRLHVARSASHPAEDESSEEQAFVGSPHQRDSVYDHAVNHDEQTEREPTGDDGHEELAGGVGEREDVGSTYLDHAEYQGENGEADYDESEQYDDAQEHPQVPEDEADAHEEIDQFVTNDEPEPLPDADPTHKGSADPESTEYQERDDGHEEGDAEVTSTITASTHADDTGFPGDELRVLTDVRDSAVTGAPQVEEIDDQQAHNTEHSTTVSGDVYREEQTEDDGFTEDGEAEDDVAYDELAQSTSPRNNLGVVTSEEEKGAASHEDTDEYIAQEAELATPAISSGVEILEPVDPGLHAEEDEENAESWELDDGYAIWEETAEGDEFDIGLAEPDSVSTGSSTLSGKTASIASKRSFDAIDESEPTVEQASLQNLKKTRTR